ncbi:transmembrane amino acid transporter protein-domain-containing protein [Peziza echinospora]|nr:transmembrane amino acid transporter protein-domain-containing protein [Peziza echinospora]
MSYTSKTKRTYSGLSGLSGAGSYASASSSSTARPENHGSTSPAASSPFQDIPSRSQRRSSISNTVDAIRHAGGPNSIDNFARSWTRAAGYFEITPSQTFFLASDGINPNDPEARIDPYAPTFDDDATDDDYDGNDDDDEDDGHLHPPTEHSRMIGPGPSLRGSFRGTYGSLGTIQSIRETVGHTIAPRLNDGSMRHAASMFQGEQAALASDLKEREPMLVKRVEREDGKVVAVIVGQSTLPQTVFNSVNVLIGVGLLSLPLGLKYSGWVIGLIFLAFSASITNYTGKLLALCLNKAKDQTLVTYADIAYVAFGHHARIWISFLFSMELLTACVALIILFGDSLNVLMPSVSVTEWKILAGIILTPLSFLPLRVLSFSSVLGILSCFGIVVIIFIDGLSKPERPGSLRDPMTTHMWPVSWAALPMSFGLLMSPWGGHSVFPNIYKDMRHPHKYNKGVDITYAFTFGLDLFLAVIGVLMFGDLVRDEITSSVLNVKSYNQFLSMIMVIFIAIIPLTKTPLNARPIVTTIEVMFGIDPRSLAMINENMVGVSPVTRGVAKILIRIFTNAAFVIIAILFPSFDRIMGLLGSFLCFSICVILPIAFYLKICAEDISITEKRVCWVLLVISTIFAAMGTVWSFLPAGVLPDW